MDQHNADCYLLDYSRIETLKNMNYTEERLDNVLDSVTQWIKEQGEVLLLFRYPYLAGAKEYEIHFDMDTIRNRIDSLQPGTNVIAIKTYDVNLRGVVDEAFISNALNYISEGEEFMIFEKTTTSFYRDVTTADTQKELQKDVREYLGFEMAIGKHPEWDEPHIQQIDCYIGGKIERAY